LDGTVPQVLWHVTLRRAMPAVLASGVWVIAMAASDMTVTDLYQIRTLAEELYTDYATGGDVRGVAAGPSLVAFTAALAGLVMVGLSAAMVPAWRGGERPCVRFTLGRWRIPATALVGAVLLLVVGVPVGNLIYQAGTVVEHVGADRVRGWSAGRFWELLLPAPATYRVSALWQFRREFSWTLVIGACAATMSVAVAVPLAWWARRGGVSAFVMAGLTSLGLATMGPLVGLALIWLFTLSDHPWLVWSYDRTILAPILAACWRSLPLSLLICWVSLGSVSRSLVDCATLDGAGRLTRLWHAGVMPRGSSLGVAWLVALAVALGELSATILVAPPGVRTISIRLFGLLHAGVENQAAAVCLMILGLYGVVTGLLVTAIRFAVRAAGSARLPFVRA